MSVVRTRRTEGRRKRRGTRATVRCLPCGGHVPAEPRTMAEPAMTTTIPLWHEPERLPPAFNSVHSVNLHLSLPVHRLLPVRRRHPQPPCDCGPEH